MAEGAPGVTPGTRARGAMKLTLMEYLQYAHASEIVAGWVR
jgi:hypothetical protein